MHIVPDATASCDLWEQMLVCFFLSVESGIDAFLKTNSLSQNTSIGPSIRMPNMRSLYLKASTCPTAILIAMNSLPNVLASTVVCRLLYHTMGALLTNSKTPVCDRLVTVLPA